MLDALRFVQGAVAKKDFVPALTHFRIADGTIYGYNGSIGLCCPIDLQLDIAPKALPFVKAIQTCKSTISLSMNSAGKLLVKSGSFKAQIECTTEPYPELKPEGDTVPVQEGFLDALRVLAPFIAEDASRPWARGILFRGQSAFATNNVVLVEYWVGSTTPVEINVPENAVKELLRIGEDPTHLQVTPNSATFHYSGNRWLRTQLLDLGWPDLSKVLDRDANPQPFPEAFWEAIDDLKPFVDEVGRVFLSAGKVSTTSDASAGAESDVEGLAADACINHRFLSMIQPIAERVDWSLYPGPCLFVGDRLRGAIVGIRK